VVCESINKQSHNRLCFFSKYITIIRKLFIFLIISQLAKVELFAYYIFEVAFVDTGS